jgi:hypothetical protein
MHHDPARFEIVAETRRSPWPSVPGRIGFRSLTESFDTKTAIGRAVLVLLAAVGEDERERLREPGRA